MIISTFCQFFTILIIVFLVFSVGWFYLFRFLQGVFEGVTLPLSYVLVSEILPYDIRGKGMIVLVIFEVLGSGR